jgi:hypothetical protein
VKREFIVVRGIKQPRECVEVEETSGNKAKSVTFRLVGGQLQGSKAALKESKRSIVRGKL